MKMARLDPGIQATTCDVAIIGSGLAGLIAAWACRQSGLDVVQISPALGEPDGRTTALLQDSIDYLDQLNLWENMKAEAFPLKTMRIIDATNRLIRAPQVDFVCQEVDLEAFGYNIENRRLAERISADLTGLQGYSRIEDTLDGLQVEDGGGVVLQTTSGKTVRAKTVIGADGRNSPVRQHLDIDVRQWQYPQIALVGNFSHTLPHNDVSTEFHTETGPFTLVPLGQNRSSLVCVVAPAQAERLQAMDSAALNLILEERMQSVLGKVILESPLKGFPLSGMVAKRFGKGPIVLVGEAAHIFPPIGAQGLNLGLRDIREAVTQISRAISADAKNPSGNPATGRIGENYHSARSSDINTRTASVDLLNRSLLSGFLAVQMVRSAGLYTLGSLSPLRRLMMREGVAPGMAARSFRSRIDKKLRPATEV